jgi:hypothetical protein
MDLTARWILSPVRLPVSPRRRIKYDNPSFSSRQGEILAELVMNDSYFVDLNPTYRNLTDDE